MSDLFRALQALILGAADTMSVWRDGAVLLLAAAVILLLTMAFAGRPDA